MNFLGVSCQKILQMPSTPTTEGLVNEHLCAVTRVFGRIRAYETGPCSRWRTGPKPRSCPTRANKTKKQQQQHEGVISRATCRSKLALPKRQVHRCVAVSHSLSLGRFGPRSVAIFCFVAYIFRGHRVKESARSEGAATEGERQKKKQPHRNVARKKIFPERGKLRQRTVLTK